MHTIYKMQRMSGFIAVSLSLILASCGREERRNNSQRSVIDQATKPTNSGDATVKKPVDEPVDQGTTAEGPASDDPVDSAVDLNKITVPIGLRSFNQINATMSALTGVPITNAVIRTAFASLSTGLPTGNDIKTFLGSNQVAIFKLAIEYCDTLVKDPTLRASFFPGFNFAATPAVALTAAGKQQLADVLVAKLWGQNLASLPPHAQSVATVVGIIDNVLVGKSLTTASVTPAVVTGVCTAVLASAPIAIY